MAQNYYCLPLVSKCTTYIHRKLSTCTTFALWKIRLCCGAFSVWVLFGDRELRQLLTNAWLPQETNLNTNSTLSIQKKKRKTFHCWITECEVFFFSFPKILVYWGAVSRLNCARLISPKTTFTRLHRNRWLFWARREAAASCAAGSAAPVDRREPEARCSELSSPVATRWPRWKQKKIFPPRLILRGWNEKSCDSHIRAL